MVWNDLAKLEKTQFQAIRVALGCIRSTPTLALIAESREPSLGCRRKLRAAIYVLKNLAKYSKWKNYIFNLAIKCRIGKFWKKNHTPLLTEGLELVTDKGKSSYVNGWC